MSSVHETKRKVSEYSLLIHERGWVANHDGNVSARVQGGRFLITPTGVSKRLCTPDTLVVCEASGKPVGPGKPPSEVGLHAGAYRRSDVAAVIHAHPPHASAFALARRALEPVTMPEVVVSLGDRVPLVPLFLPKDPRAEDAVAEALSIADVALLSGNGVIVTGADLEQAYLRLELLEHYAKILTITAAIGGPAPLEGDLKAKLLDLRKAAGLGPKPQAAPAAGSSKPEPAARSKLTDSIRPIVAEEVRRVLGGSK